MTPGLFITLEGSEGSGKSSGAAFLKSRLEADGHRVLLTREPGGTTLGEVLRDIVLTRDDLACTPMAELLIVFAARAQHIENRIKPALAQGVTVLCDRFTEASFAYQGGGRELGAARVCALEALVHSDLQPDLTLLLDVPPDVGLARARREGGLDKIERESAHFFERVRSAHLARAAAFPDRIRVIDGCPPAEQVQQALWDAVSARLAGASP
ncbi:MAG: dTMP kinase [Pseudomonadota bacterium]